MHGVVKKTMSARTMFAFIFNGISSEAVIAEMYGPDRVIDCVALGMDAVKEENRLNTQHGTAFHRRCGANSQGDKTWLWQIFLSA